MNDEQRDELTSELVASYRAIGGINCIGEKNLPSQASAVAILHELLALVFSGYYGEPLSGEIDVKSLVAERLARVEVHMCEAIKRVLVFCEGCEKKSFGAEARKKTAEYLKQLPEIRRLLDLDVKAAFDGDPAARSPEEVILCYPGLVAVSAYRLAHPLQVLDVPLLPRMMSEWAHSRSGADIHPGAVIGQSFFIDHSTGVVIGETAEIGDHVIIYQGVTLGALSFKRHKDGTLVKGGKRHPTIGNKVTIYANATILGGETVIGEGAVVGGGVWVNESVAPGARWLLGSKPGL